MAADDGSSPANAGGYRGDCLAATTVPNTRTADCLGGNKSVRGSVPDGDAA